MIKVSEYVQDLMNQSSTLTEKQVYEKFRAAFGVSLTSKNAVDVHHEIMQLENGRRKHTYSYKDVKFLIMEELSSVVEEKDGKIIFSLRWRVT